MATVFKRSNSKHWQCAFTSVDGRRVYKSTGETKKGKARDVAAELESRARKLDPAGRQGQRAVLAVIEESTALALKGKRSLSTRQETC